MTDLDPERLTLRQAAQARDDFAQVMDELNFVKELIARLPTRRDQAFVPLKIMFGSQSSAPRSSFFGWRRSGGIASELAALFNIRKMRTAVPCVAKGPMLIYSIRVTRPTSLPTLPHPPALVCQTIVQFRIQPGLLPENCG